MTRTYSIEPAGKKWATVCRTDGFWAMTWHSKNKRRARQKGDEFVSGRRTSMRKYLTPYGRKLNEVKSTLPRRSIVHGSGEITGRQFAVLLAALLVDDLAGDD